AQGGEALEKGLLREELLFVLPEFRWIGPVQDLGDGLFRHPASHDAAPFRQVHPVGHFLQLLHIRTVEDRRGEIERMQVAGVGQFGLQQPEAEFLRAKVPAAAVGLLLHKGDGSEDQEDHPALHGPEDGAETGNGKASVRAERVPNVRQVLSTKAGDKLRNARVPTSKKATAVVSLFTAARASSATSAMAAGVMRSMRTSSPRCSSGSRSLSSRVTCITPVHDPVSRPREAAWSICASCRMPWKRPLRKCAPQEKAGKAMSSGSGYGLFRRK